MAIATAQHFIDIIRIYAATIYACLVWDWLESLHREYVVIWRAEWSALKVAYLFNRYYGIGAFGFTLFAYCSNSISTETCRTMVHFVPGVCIPVTLVTELILGLRCYAIWGRKKWMLGALLFVLTAEAAVMSYAAVSVMSVMPDGVPGPCLPASLPGKGSVNAAFFMLPFVIDTALTAITFYKAYTIQKITGHSDILRLFMRDGMIYYFVVASVNLLSAGLYLQDNVGLQAVNAAASLMISQIMCSHMVLALREEGARNRLGAQQRAGNVNTENLKGAGSVVVHAPGIRSESKHRHHTSIVHGNAHAGVVRLPASGTKASEYDLRTVGGGRRFVPTPAIDYDVDVNAGMDTHKNKEHDRLRESVRDIEDEIKAAADKEEEMAQTVSSSEFDVHSALDVDMEKGGFGVRHANHSHR